MPLVSRHGLNNVKHDTGGTHLSNGSTTFPVLMASTSLFAPPPHDPDPRSFPSPGRIANTLQSRVMRAEQTRENVICKRARVQLLQGAGQGVLHDHAQYNGKAHSADKERERPKGQAAEVLAWSCLEIAYTAR